MKWVEVASTIVQEADQTTYLSIIGEDITERKKVSEALSRSNAQLQDLINNTTDLIQITGVSGRFLFVNKAWLETMGYSEEEARDLKIQDVLHPEFAHNTQAQFDLLSKGEELPEFTAVFEGKMVADSMFRVLQHVVLNEAHPRPTVVFCITRPRKFVRNVRINCSHPLRR